MFHWGGLAYDTGSAADDQGLLVCLGFIVERGMERCL